MKITNHKKSKKGIILAIAGSFIAVVAIIFFILNNQNTTILSSGIKETVNSDLVIETKDITEKALFYPVTVEGINLEVIAVKASDGTIRTAFNTCQVCNNSGKGYYKQEGDQLVCQNCGNRFGMDDVEVNRGGCNPFPITEELKTVEADKITVSKDILKQATVLFETWK